MEQGAFIVSQSTEYPKELQFNTTAFSPSSEQLKLKDGIDRTLITLQSIFKDDDNTYQLYFHQLLSLAQAGLVGPNANPEIARQALSNLKYDIMIKMSGVIKNKYMKKLGLIAFTLMLISLLAGFLSNCYKLPITNFIILWAACMPGVWLSFGARKTILTFENLSVIEEDRMEPIIRLFFAGLLTIIIGLILSIGFIKISIGGISTENFNSDYRLIVLIGALCGFSEQVLSEKVARYASELLK